MATWKITPTWKKSVIERQTWTKEGVDGCIEHEIGWRYGEFIIETEGDEPPVLEAGVNIFDYECDDWSTDDGCWEETDVGLEEGEERDRLEEFLEENSIFDLEEEGWVMDECEMIIDCDMNIEKVEG
jgi:hypothetical protein